MTDGKVLEFTGVTKTFDGIAAVSDFTARVDPGFVTAFLGPNGAGKTTTLRILLGQLRANAGKATIDGRTFAQLTSPRRHVGWVPESPTFRARRTATKHLTTVARQAGVPASRVAEVLSLVGLSDVADMRISGYSLGMTQRLAVAEALIGDPGVLILDEPANGLDPEGIRWMRLLMRRLADEGRTVLVSSHLLSEIQQVADRLLVISNGSLVFAGAIEDLEDASSLSVTVDAADRAALSRALRDAGYEFELLRSGISVHGASAAQIGALAASAGIALTTLQQRSPSLEDVFIQLVSGQYVAPMTAALPPAAGGPVDGEGAEATDDAGAGATDDPGADVTDDAGAEATDDAGAEATADAGAEATDDAGAEDVVIDPEQAEGSEPDPAEGRDSAGDPATADAGGTTEATPATWGKPAAGEPTSDEEFAREVAEADAFLQAPALDGDPGAAHAWDDEDVAPQLTQDDAAEAEGASPSASGDADDAEHAPADDDHGQQDEQHHERHDEHAPADHGDGERDDADVPDVLEEPDEIVELDDDEDDAAAAAEDQDETVADEPRSDLPPLSLPGSARLANLLAGGSEPVAGAAAFLGHDPLADDADHPPVTATSADDRATRTILIPTFGVEESTEDEDAAVVEGENEEGYSFDDILSGADGVGDADASGADGEQSDDDGGVEESSAEERPEDEHRED
ncbi:ATP-binding cassette domain-containing protein [Microbacterium oryzae]|uniref:ATP-binding cassette domain-containing protein n=1 Tax=Microbacterium oryzae TaxID=743009 RepID=UPI0025B0B6EF|nr:ATP-binding cassette domain-containing protein [Microbacterium oryzae]MDN3310871.1 ATP-binding cassette domain-containing protein [Microbacterium oryzae]